MRQLLGRILTAALLLVAWPAWATNPQVLTGGSGATLSTTTTQFFSLTGYSNTIGTVDSAASGVMPSAGTISALYVALTVDPGTGTTRIITIRKNQTDQTLTCTVTGASGANLTCSDLTHSFSVVAGDILSFSDALTGTPAGASVGLSVLFTPTTNNETAILARAPTTQTGSTAYAALSNGTLSTWNTTETVRQNVMPDTGTVSNLYVQVTAAAGAAKSYAYTVDKNTTPQTLTTSITGAGSGAGITTNNDGSHSFAVSPGDLLDYSAAPTGTPAANSTGLGVKFVSATAGNFVFLYDGQGPDSAASATSTPVQGDKAPSGSENTTQAPVSATMYVLGIRVVDTDPGGTASRTFSVRKNGADTFTCLLLHGNTTAACSGSATFSPGDLIDVRNVPTGSPATGNPLIGLVATTVAPVSNGHNLALLGVGN